ncbi:restriction endonuclease subunit S [Streptomyces sp. Je 1-332]|uniref:restriction endonuclease subunit S n=1 Tax=Streptomyces sp. Je 1-332 TaxID=3231270 RepID=UPI0034583546
MSASGAFPYETLSDLADVSGGVTLGRAVPEGASVELPYLRVANVQDGYIDTADMKTVRVLQSEVSRFAVRRGDVLLTEGGDFDKLGRGAVWDGRLEPCLHQNHVFRVRCRESVLLPEYLALYLASDEGRRYFLSIAKQTTNLATINSSQLKAMPILSPPLAEQRRIVEVLAALALEERAIEAAIAKLNTVRHGVLISAIPVASDVVSDGDGAWPTVREVGEVRMGKQLSPSSKAFGTQLPYLRVANVFEGEISYGDVKEMGFSPSERQTYKLEPGDILLNEGQENLHMVGRSAIYEGAPGAYCFQNTLIRFRPGVDVLSDYAQAVFVAWRWRGVFARVAEKTSISHLGGTRFASLAFPKVSLESQRSIVGKLAAWDERIASEQGALAKLRSVKSGVIDDLLSARVRLRDVA